MDYLCGQQKCLVANDKFKYPIVWDNIWYNGSSDIILYG